MKNYWDSSALIEVALLHPKARPAFLADKEKITRLHSFAEILPHSPAASWASASKPAKPPKEFARWPKKMTIVELDENQAMTALDQAEKRGVRGGGVHDYLHAIAAETNGAKKIITYNQGDFAAVTKLTVEKP